MDYSKATSTLILYNWRVLPVFFDLYFAYAFFLKLVSQFNNVERYIAQLQYLTVYKRHAVLVMP